MAKKLLTILLLSLLIVPASFAAETLKFDCSDEVLINPFMGLVAWATDNPELLEQDFSLVYVDVTWAEFEPEEGYYDFKALEERCQFELWKSMGKKAVFRFVIDEPTDKKHMDIPQWLYDKTKDGKNYNTSYGKGYSPDYSNKTLIQAHEKAINAIAERYDDDPFIAFVELGSLGHWGEWHVHEKVGSFPLPKIYNQYIDHYTESFTKTKLLMRRPFSSIKNLEVGLFNDASGLEKDTTTWLSWIENGGDYEGRKNELSAMPNRWKTSPIGGELSSNVDEAKLLGKNFKTQLELFEQAHTSWIGPHAFTTYKTRTKKERKNLDTLLTTIGYRFYVSKMKIDDKNITFTMENVGIAPFYFSWDVVVKLEYEDGSEQLITADIDINEIMPGKDAKFTVSYGQNLKAVYIAILNPEDYSEGAYLAMDTERDGFFQKLK